MLAASIPSGGCGYQSYIFIPPVNSSGQIDVSCIQQVYTHFGSVATNPALAPFDFNHDGVVDQTDVNMLIEDMVDTGFYMAAGQTVVVMVTPEGTPSGSPILEVKDSTGDVVSPPEALDWKGNWELTFQAATSGVYTLYASLGCGYQPNIFAPPVDPSTGKIDADLHRRGVRKLRQRGRQPRPGAVRL